VSDTERQGPWLMQNLTDQEVNSSSTLTLACLAYGVPIPYITWYKDNTPVTEGPGKKALMYICAFIRDPPFRHETVLYGMWRMFLIHLSIMLPGITLKDDGTLIIERVKKDDAGIYECRASNAGGEAKTSAVINVVGEWVWFLVMTNTSPAFISLFIIHILRV